MALRQSKTATGAITGNGNQQLSLTLNSPILAGSALIVTIVMSIHAGQPAGSETQPGLPTGGGIATWGGLVRNPGAGPGDPSAEYGMTAWGMGASGGSQAIQSLVSQCYDGGTWLMIASEFTGVSAVLAQPDATGTRRSPANGLTNVPSAAVSTTNGTDLVYAAIIGQDRDVPIAGPTGGFTQIARVNTTQYPANSSGATDFDHQIIAAWRETTLAGTYAALWNKAQNVWAPDWWGTAVALKLTGPASALAGRSDGLSGDFAMLSGPSNVYVPVAVFNVPDRWLFGDVDLSTFAYTVTRSIDADSHPARRGSLAPLPGRPGTLNIPLLHAGRIVTVELYVWPVLGSGTPTANDRIQARANLDALHAILARGNVQNLVRVMPDGTGRLALAMVQDVQESDSPLNGTLFGLTVRFYLPDPYWYTNTVVDGPRSVAASPMTFTVIHTGSVPHAGHVLFEFLGPITDPRVTNQANGVWVQYTGAVPNNQRLIIDSEHFSATLNGASVIGAITHGGGENEFMWFEPGTNPLVVTATAPGGSITTSFSPSYI